MANVKAEQGRALYRQGRTLAEIAKALGVSDSTVRSWKRRDPEGWPDNATGATDATQRTRNVAPEPLQKKSKKGRKPSGKYDIADMVAKIDEYVDETKENLPILKECCLLNGWNYDYVMQLQRQHDELAQSIKKLLDWKEVRLERGALFGDFDRTMVIFTLKQPAHGWSDKPVSKEGIELEDLTPLAEMLKDDQDTDDTMETVQPET